MTDKAYIVANKRQELEVLKKFEYEGMIWLEGEKPTEWVPSENGTLSSFPYLLIEKDKITWSPITQSEDKTIVYDGRKEEKMSDKYLVTQEFMDKLSKWRNDEDINVTSGKSYNYINHNDLENLPAIVVAWWVDDKKPIERNNRLIAIIQWLNGEGVFEVEEPHKFIVRSKEIHSDGHYSYVKVFDQMTLHTDYKHAMKFDTREEAHEWSHSHQVVVEIDEDGNEVEE